MGRSLILGFFDGVHIAHQTVIRSADKFGTEKVLITLKNFNKNTNYILSRENSFEKIKSLGVKKIVELDFTEISAMPANDFIKYLAEEYSPASISTGYNYTFGHKKEGNSELLESKQKEFGYEYVCLPPQLYEGETISSTLIKKYLQNGNIERANTLLGSNFILEGRVISGARLGRKIGFPTANINYPQDIVKIPYGVYKVKVGENIGVLNWGMKPTVHNTKEPVIEVHILNYDGNLYDKDLKAEIIKKLRNEKKFDSIEDLKFQINEDIKECLK